MFVGRGRKIEGERKDERENNLYLGNKQIFLLYIKLSFLFVSVLS